MKDKEECSKVFKPFINKDFSNWKIWNSDCIACCLDDFFVRQTEFVSGFAGSNYIPAQFAYYKADNFSKNIRIWYRSDKFLKLDAEFPDIDLRFPDQFAGFDHPVTKMDYSFGGTIIRDGEWVYPDQGISFFLNGDYNRIIKVMVFLPITIETYKKEMRTSAPVREF